MTASPQVVYACDRCNVREAVTLDSAAPPHQRMSGPDGWLMIRVGNDPSVTPQHFCPVCNAGFELFMVGKPSTVERYDAVCAALHAVRKWAEAYPVQLFPALDRQELDHAGKILDEDGVGAGRVHAQWARHILQEIVETVDRGLPKDQVER